MTNKNFSTDKTTAKQQLNGEILKYTYPASVVCSE